MTENSFPAKKIRLNDLDTPIYRIFPLRFLEEALDLCQLVLVQPTRWDDPFEVIGEILVVEIRRGDRYEQEILQGHPPVYAQCWSRTAESDSLLRAYSRVVKDTHSGRNVLPREEGVRVRSTPRKLLEAIRAGAPASPRGHWFIGAVEYLERDALQQKIVNEVDRVGRQFFENPENRATLLLMKREAFAHESEVRVVFVQQDQEPRPDMVRIPINPSEVFEEISFDPRLELFESRERENVARGFKYTGAIQYWGMYMRTILSIVIENPGEQWAPEHAAGNDSSVEPEPTEADGTS